MIPTLKRFLSLLIRIAFGGALLLLLLFGGCWGWNLQGEGFPDNDLSELCRQYRKPDGGTGPAGVSTKARQIERSLGIED